MKDSKGRVIEFRAYEASDFKGLRDMYDTFEPKGIESGLPPANDETRYKWIEMMVSSFFNVLAIHNGCTIGHAALDALADQGSPEYLIFVKKEFRHCGIGTKISDTVKQVAKNIGCKKVWLNVRTGNSIAIRVFKKVGFQFVGKIDIQRDMELELKNRKK
jgi:RimJ/RimL family protein N-acetyltransferase